MTFFRYYGPNLAPDNVRASRNPAPRRNHEGRLARDAQQLIDHLAVVTPAGCGASACPHDVGDQIWPIISEKRSLKI